MTFNPNQDSFKKLLALIEADPKSCVFCVGTGVTAASQPIGFPHDKPNPTTWVGLLKNGIEWVRRSSPSDADVLLATLDGASSEAGADGLTHAASKIRKILTDEEFGLFLKECFGSLTVQPEFITILDAIALALLRGARVLTTNYDMLLEARLPDGRYDLVVPGDNGLATRFSVASLEPKQNAIFHVHGVYDRPDSIVLTAEDYEAAYQGSKKALLENLFMNHRLIFIGCGMGLQDENVGKSLFGSGLFLQKFGKDCFFVGNEGEFDALRRFSPPVGLEVDADVGRAELATLANLTVELIETGTNEAGFPDLLSFGAAFIEKLKSTPFDPFDLIKIDAGVRNAERDPLAEAPSCTEWNSGAIPKPPAYDQVELWLADPGKRALGLSGKAAMGKSILGIHCALDALQLGRKVYWWRMVQQVDELNIETVDRKLEALLQVEDALVVVDEAHVDPARAKALFEIAQNCDRGKLLIIWTIGVTNFILPNDCRANFVTDPGFFKLVGQAVFQRLGRTDFDEISDSKFEEWYTEFKGRTAWYVRSLLVRLGNGVAPESLELALADNADWMSERLKEFRSGTSQAKVLEQMAAMAMVAKTFDPPLQFWVSPAQLDIPDFDEAAAKMINQTGLFVQRRRMGETQLRLMNPDHDSALICRARALVTNLALPLDEVELCSDAYVQARACLVMIGLFRLPSLALIYAPGPKKLSRGGYTPQLGVLSAPERSALSEMMQGSAKECALATNHGNPFTTAPLIEWLNENNPELARDTVEQMRQLPEWQDAALAERRLNGAGKMASAIAAAGRSSDPTGPSIFADFADRITSGLTGRDDRLSMIYCGGQTIEECTKILKNASSLSRADKLNFILEIIDDGISRNWSDGSWLKVATSKNTLYNRFSIANLFYELIFSEICGVKELDGKLLNLGVSYMNGLLSQNSMKVFFEGGDYAAIKTEPRNFFLAAVQFAGALGAAGMALWDHNWLKFRSVRPEAVATVPVSMRPNRTHDKLRSLTHEDVVIRVVRDDQEITHYMESQQLHCWLGIYTYAYATSKELTVTDWIVEQTSALLANRLLLFSRKPRAWPTRIENGAMRRLADWLDLVREGVLPVPLTPLG